jgi:hypothetical protein
MMMSPESISQGSGIGSTAAFYAIVWLAIVALYFTYLMPVAMLLLKW